MLLDNMLSDKIIFHGWKNKLSDNMLSENTMLSDYIVLPDNIALSDIMFTHSSMNTN
jgi:hypothetical protein